MLKDMIGKSARSQMGGLLLKPTFSALQDRLSYHRFGGAPLLGIAGSVVIAHGRSDAEAICSAITVAGRAVESRVNETIETGTGGWRTDGV